MLAFGKTARLGALLIFLIGLGAIGELATPCQAQSNYVFNPGFETFTSDLGSGASQDDLFTNWTQISPSTDQAVLFRATNSAALPSSGAAFSLTVTTSGNNQQFGSLFQIIATDDVLKSGALVRFMMTARLTNTLSGVDPSVTSLSFLTFAGASTVYTNFLGGTSFGKTVITNDFIFPGGATSLIISNSVHLDPGTGYLSNTGSATLFLDNMSVEVIPEASTLAPVLMLSAAVLWGMRRRRNRGVTNIP